MRTPGWERRLKAVVEKHMALPSEYGLSDCYLIPDDAVEALTGARMYPDATGYTSPAGAAKKLRQHGYETVEDAFRGKFSEIAPTLAQRGDIGVIDRDGDVSGGVFTQLGFFTRGPERHEFMPISAVKTAFRVD